MKYIIPTRLFVTAILVLLLQPILAKAEGNLNIGADIRTVYGAFYTYNRGYTYDTFSLTGVKAEYARKLSSSDRFSYQFGGGFALFYGDHEYEIGISSDKGGSTAAAELSLFGEADMQLKPQFDVVGRLGLAFMYLYAENASENAPAPYDWEFRQGYVDLFIAVGGKYHFTANRNSSIAVLYRTDVALLSGWAEYDAWDREPENNDYNNYGFQIIYSKNF